MTDLVSSSARPRKIFKAVYFKNSERDGIFMLVDVRVMGHACNFSLRWQSKVTVYTFKPSLHSSSDQSLTASKMFNSLLFSFI